VARSEHEEHENGLIEGATRRDRGDGAERRAEGRSDVEAAVGPGVESGAPSGEYGGIAVRTAALFSVGFVLGAVAIGAMGIAIRPVDPPAVRPIELESPDEADRPRNGADRSRERGERQRERTERRRRGERAAPTAPPRPRAPQRPSAQPTPPAAAPQPAPPAPRSTPAPRPRPRPAPSPAPEPAPAPQPAPAPPPADDDGGDDDGGNRDNDSGGD
jgi:hypothetical protein